MPGAVAHDVPQSIGVIPLREIRGGIASFAKN
jgi:hypothetical protein